MTGELGQHWNNSVVCDDGEVLLVAGDARHRGTDAGQYLDVVGLEQTYYQLQTTDEATNHLTGVLHR